LPSNARTGFDATMIWTCDLAIHAIDKAVAHPDRVSREALPFLPTGAWVVSGFFAQVRVGVRGLRGPSAGGICRLALSDAAGGHDTECEANR
jgi:hypothetical protein